MANQLTDSAARERLRRLVIRLQTVVIIALALLQVLNLSIRHQEAVSRTRANALELSRLLGEHMLVWVAAVDASLKQMVIHNGRIGGPNADDGDWLPVLQSAMSGLTYVGSMTVTDAEGTIQHSTIPELVGNRVGDSSSLLALPPIQMPELLPIRRFVVKRPIKLLSRLAGDWSGQREFSGNCCRYFYS